MTIEELLQTQSICWRSGQPKWIEDLVADPSTLSKDDLLNLVCNEARLKSESGQSATLVEYQQRFAFLSAELEMQWAIDDLLNTHHPSDEIAATVASGYVTTESDERESSLPTSIGRYEVLREIGRGAASVVYEGFDANLNRSVAIKCLRTDFLNDSTEAQRFRLEAETVGRLRHPNIAQVYDSGRQANVSFIVMEYCDQGTLADILGEPLSTKQATDIMLQLTSAVAAAHAQGIIHRDLKPANVLLSSSLEGTPNCKVSDFGLAKWVDAESSATVTGTVVGSPAYMAPEQAEGKPSQVTFQADIYSLGTILFQLLTGRPPFLGATVADTLHQIRYTDPLDIRQLNFQAARDLETIAAKCMRKVPEHRYGSAQELFDELVRFAKGQPIYAKREGGFQKIVRLAKRNPQVASLVVVTIALLSIIAIGSLWHARSLRKERNLAQAATRQAENSAREALEASQESNRLETQSRQALQSLQESEAQRLEWVYRSLVDEVWAAFGSGKQGQRFKGQQALKRLVSVYPYSRMSAEKKLEVRSALAACLSQTDLHELDVIATDRHLGHSVDVDPALQVIALPGSNQKTVLKSIQEQTNRVLETNPKSSINYSLSHRFFSPNGELICEILQPQDLSNARTFRVLNRHSGKVVLAIDSPANYNILNFSFHPDGRHIFLVQHSSVEVYDLASGQLQRRSEKHYKDGFISLSPNGKWLAVWGKGQNPVLLDPSNLRVLYSIPVDKNVLAASWLGDSSKLLLACEDKNLFAWNTEHHVLSDVGHFSALEPSIISHEPGVHIRLDPKSNVAAVTGVLRSQLVDLVSYKQILEIPGEVLRLGSADGRLVVRRGVDVAMNQLMPSKALIERRRPASFAEFSPNGRWLAISGDLGVQFLDTESMRYDADLGVDPTGPVVWSPKENELTTYGIFSHLCRWPINQSDGNIQVGPPKPVVLNPSRAKLGADDQVPQHDGRFISWLPDGSKFFFSDNRHGRVFLVDAWSGSAEVLFRQPGAHQLSVSPNGRYLSVSNVHEEGVQLWDVINRQAIERWHGGCPRFSRDGRYLVLGRRGSIVVIDTNTWKIVREVKIDSPHPFHPVPVEIHPNAKTLAVAQSHSRVRLMDIESGNTIQDLVYRDADTIRWLSFSGDGTKLAVTRTDSFGFWDFRHLGREISELIPEATELVDSLALSAAESKSKIRPPVDSLVTSSDSASPDTDNVVAAVANSAFPESTTNDPTTSPNEMVPVEQESNPSSVHHLPLASDSLSNVIQVDRGSDLLPSGSWWTGYQLLATFEAIKRNYPDAIGNLDMALRLVAPDDSKARAEVLLRRSQYHSTSGNARAAISDLRQAAKLRPDHPDTLRRLSSLLLNGPEELRDPIEGNIIQSRLPPN